MIAVGFVGVYVGYIFQEVKRRPVYLVRSVHRATPESAAGPDEGRER
jgi:dolichol-phosphate mannosyltransferase